MEKLKSACCIIVAVAHKTYKEMDLKLLNKICTKNPVLIDVKCLYDRKLTKKAGFKHWRL
jgi:UDP-N-acetyl-D-mannosaminuronate dehydrogenase